MLIIPSGNLRSKFNVYGRTKKISASHSERSVLERPLPRVFLYLILS